MGDLLNGDSPANALFQKFIPTVGVWCCPSFRIMCVPALSYTVLKIMSKMKPMKCFHMIWANLCICYIILGWKFCIVAVCTGCGTCDLWIVNVKVGSKSGGYRKGITEAKLKVAINGFGRIGRNFLRCWHGRKDSPLDVVVVNDTGGVRQASHLLKYDSILGTFDADVKAVGDDAISVDGKIIKIVSSRNPLELPWG